MRMSLNKVNCGSRSNERKYAELAKKYDNCELLINGRQLVIKQSQKVVFESELTLYEEDSLTTTYLGTWPDGQSFRLVRPGKQIMDLVKLLGNETVTIGSMFPDGYAITYLVK